MYFCYYLSFGKEIHDLLFEKIWIYFTQECFVQSLVEIVPLVHEKKIFESCQLIFTISQLSLDPWKGCGPPFVKTWIPFSQGCFVLSLVLFGLWFWRRWKCEKFTDGWTDRQLDGWQAIRKSYLSFQLRYRWANKNHKIQQFKTV